MGEKMVVHHHACERNSIHCKSNWLKILINYRSSLISDPLDISGISQVLHNSSVKLFKIEWTQELRCCIMITSWNKFPYVNCCNSPKRWVAIISNILAAHSRPFTLFQYSVQFSIFIRAECSHCSQASSVG